MLQALQSSFIYDRLIISWVNDLPQPELAAEVVDFLIRFEEVDWAVCARRLPGPADPVGAGGGRERAGRARCCARWSASWAGPAATTAGPAACIPLPSTSASAVEEVQAELRRRLLKALHIDECRGQRLVALREMLQNLQA